jgi:hypothetical protein
MQQLLMTLCFNNVGCWAEEKRKNERPIWKMEP